MPYSYPNNVPTYIKSLPEGAKKLFIRVFNRVVEERLRGSKSPLAEKAAENIARQAAWHVVKQKYVKKGEKWVRKPRTFSRS